MVVINQLETMIAVKDAMGEGKVDWEAFDACMARWEQRRRFGKRTVALTGITFLSIVILYGIGLVF